MTAPCHCRADERRGWRIVVIAFILDALALGGRGLFAVTILYFEELWAWQRNTAAGLNSCVHVVIAISTIVNGHVADRYPPRVTLGCGLCFLALCYALIAVLQSPWQGWVVYGVMSGWAWGALNLNVFSVAVVNSLPERHHNFAIGIANTGSTFGMMALVPLFDAVAASYGWRTGYIILAVGVAILAIVSIFELHEPTKPPPPAEAAAAGVTLVTAVASASDIKADVVAVMMPDVAEDECAHPAGSMIAHRPPATAAALATAPAPAPAPATAPTTDGTEAPADAPLVPPLATKLRTLFTSRAYWLLSLSFVICGITTTGFIETHLVALAVSYGFDATTGALAFSVLSACNGIGMILAGWLCDRVSRTLTLSAIFAVRGGAFMLLLSSTRSPAVLFLFASLFGIADYSVVPPVISLVRSQAGQHTVGLGVGILLAWHSMAAAIGAWMGGEIYQQSSSYDAALVVCAIVCFVAAVACAAAGPDEPLLRKRLSPPPPGGAR